MQSVNGTQILDINFSFLLFGAAYALVFGIVIVSLTCIYVSLQSHKLDFIYFNSNYCPKFTLLTQCIIKEIYYCLLFYYHTIKLTLDHLFFSLYFLEIYIFLGISVSNPIFSVSLSTFPELFYCEVIETFAILSMVLLLVKSPVPSDLL